MKFQIKKYKIIKNKEQYSKASLKTSIANSYFSIDEYNFPSSKNLFKKNKNKKIKFE